MSDKSVSVIESHATKIIGGCILAAILWVGTQQTAQNSSLAVVLTKLEYIGDDVSDNKRRIDRLEGITHRGSGGRR